MFTKEDILARLQNGESIDEIAKEMTDALNAADAQYQEETIKANAEKLEAERVKEAKRAAVDMMLDGLCDYLVAAGEGELLEDLKDADTDIVVDMIDSAIELTKTLEKLGNLEFAGLPFPMSVPKVEKKEEHKCGKGDCGCSKPDPAKVGFKLGQIAGLTDADAIIKSFLKDI